MRPSARTLIAAAVMPVLAGCVQDTASYVIGGERNHAITVARAQKWFWSDAVDVSIIAAHQPECLGGIDVRDVPRMTELVLHQAPDEYAEPIYILTVEGDHYAVSTVSCRVQKFPQAPAETGPVLGRFAEEDGRLRFVAAPQR
jgi:hypothetical protein